VKIGLAQFDPTIGDFDYNCSRILHFTEKARDAGCHLVVFPELSLCGYPPRDLLERQEFISDNLRALDRVMAEAPDIGVLCGYASPSTRDCGKSIQNTAVLFEKGIVLGQVHKRLLPSYDLFDETRYFEPGAETRPLPFRGRALGITICEDIWNDRVLFPRRIYPVDPVAELAAHNPDIFINISSSPFDIKKADFRRHILSYLATKYRRPFVYVNTVGGQDGIIFDGNSLAIDPKGNLVVQAADFAEDLVALDTESMNGDMRRVSGSREEMIVNALQLGLKDYMRKCGFSRAVLGLSGGVDSSVTAAVAVMALGAENVLGVLMPSPYTSKESVEDAAALAESLKMRTVTVPINDVFCSYLQALAPHFAGQETDITEENLQARIRGNILMAISNKFGHLVLSTGNKTELAVGYCTLYGDLSGGYALISDVPKTMVYEIARHINSKGAVIPQKVLTKAPSAELKENQKDQDDLPPYDLLDAVLELYLEQNASPEQIIGQGHDRDLVRRIVQMVDRSEYKRHQAPLGPRITTRSFGYGRRYPIAHGYRTSF